MIYYNYSARANWLGAGEWRRSAVERTQPSGERTRRVSSGLSRNSERSAGPRNDTDPSASTRTSCCAAAGPSCFASGSACTTVSAQSVASTAVEVSVRDVPEVASRMKTGAADSSTQVARKIWTPVKLRESPESSATSAKPHVLDPNTTTFRTLSSLRVADQPHTYAPVGRNGRTRTWRGQGEREWRAAVPACPVSATAVPCISPHRGEEEGWAKKKP